MNTRHSTTQIPEIIPIPAFQDNYIWLLRVGNHAAVVDPGDASVVESFLAQHDLTLTAILITHHHADHTGGIAALVRQRDIPVFGPTQPHIEGVSIGVGEGDEIDVPGLDWHASVLEVPGHTTSHIAYVAPGILFPGDTLFSGGCGRLLGGSAAQLHASLSRLAALPDDTKVYCTHEYTLANLAFARAAEPHNTARDRWLEHCQNLRAQGLPTLPSTIEREKQINPFLRVDAAEVRTAISAHSRHNPGSSLESFTALRAWKDDFRITP